MLALGAVIAPSAGAVGDLHRGVTAAPPTATAVFANGTLTVGVRDSIRLGCARGSATVSQQMTGGGPWVPVPIAPSPPACPTVTGLVATSPVDVEVVDLTGADDLAVQSITVNLAGSVTTLALPAIPAALSYRSANHVVFGAHRPGPRQVWRANDSRGSVTVFRAGTRIATVGKASAVFVSSDEGDLRVRLDRGGPALVVSTTTSVLRIDNHGVDFGWFRGSLQPLRLLVLKDGSGNAVVEDGPQGPIAVYDFRLESWVPQLYRRLLQRAGSARDVDGWVRATTHQLPGDPTGRYAYYTSRTMVTRDFITSPEFRRTLVTGAFREVLGRTPSPGEIPYWVSRLSDGWTPDHLRAALAGSAEFAHSAGSGRSALVTAMFRRLLGRDPDKAGLAYFVHRLDIGATPTYVARQMLATDEAAHRHAVARFEQALARTPDAPSANSWAAQIQRRGELAVLVALSSSDEAVNQANRP